MYVLYAKWCKHWQDPFAELLKIDGQVYRELEGRKTFRFEMNGEGYFAKLHHGVGWKEIFKNLLRGCLPVVSAKNEWLAIQRLEQLYIPTMRLVGYGCSGYNPAKLKSFIITKELTPIISLQDLSQEWIANPPTFQFKKALIERVAIIAKTLHENGINHRDFYIGHFLLDLAMGKANLQANNLLIYLIDLHRVQLRKKTPARWRLKDISGLYFSCLNIQLTQHDLLRFIKNYTEKPLKIELQENKKFWQTVRKRALKLYQRSLIKPAR